MIQFEVVGHIFKPSGEQDWSISHAQVPFAYSHPDGFIRIFYATRSIESASSASFIDVDIDNPSNIQYIHDKPILEKGSLGFFDDSGTMPSWFLKYDNKLLMYYTAWNKSKEASYRLSIGIAESYDNGVTFKKVFMGPILDRSIFDPIWVGQPCIIKEDNIWKMWYLSCEKIEYIHNHPEPFYNIKFAESKDGVNWTRKGITCIPFDHENGVDSIGRPFVYKQNGIYKMLHSNRSAYGYRHNSENSYKIKYSESENGLDWVSKEMKIQGLNQAWCNLMHEYASILITQDKTYMFFNGNGFGASGFGYSELIENI